MEIKASSKYDWETVKKFSHFSLFTRYKVFNIIYFAWLFLHMLSTLVPVLPEIIAYSQAYGFSFDMIDDGVISYGCLIIVWVLCLLFFSTIYYKSRKAIHNAENRYVFTDEKIQFTQNATGVNTNTAIEYTAVYRVYETKEFLYMSLLTNKRTTYIIDKSTVEGGTTEDLRMLLISKIGADKYKVKCKNL